jgi:hypothetical protein
MVVNSSNSNTTDTGFLSEYHVGTFMISDEMTVISLETALRLSHACCSTYGL